MKMQFLRFLLNHLLTIKLFCMTLRMGEVTSPSKQKCDFWTPVFYEIALFGRKNLCKSSMKLLCFAARNMWIIHLLMTEI